MLTDPAGIDVLVVHDCTPWPIEFGAQQRIAKLAETLAQSFQVVTTYPVGTYIPVGTGEAPVDVRPLTSWSKANAFSRYASFATTRDPWVGWSTIGRVTSELQSVVDELRPRVIIWGHSFLAAIGMKRIRTDALHVIDVANVEVLRTGMLAAENLPLRPRLVGELEHRRARRWEPVTVRKADLCLALKQADLDWLNNVGAETMLVRNGVPSVETNPSPGNGHLVALGLWSYPPNGFGLSRFLEEDWPRLKERLPSSQLLIAGRGGQELLNELSESFDKEGVSALGFVDDLGELFSSADVVLAPAVSGGGSQLKLAEAIGRGRVTVGPPYLAAEVTPEMTAFVRSTTDMASEIAKLMSDHDRRWQAELELTTYAQAHTWAGEAEPLIDWIRQRL